MNLSTAILLCGLWVVVISGLYCAAVRFRKRKVVRPAYDYFWNYAPDAPNRISLAELTFAYEQACGFALTIFEAFKIAGDLVREGRLDEEVITEENGQIRRYYWQGANHEPRH